MACSFGTAKADCPPRYNCHVIAIIQSLPGYTISVVWHTHTNTHTRLILSGNGCPILFNMYCCCCCRQYFKHNFLCSHNFANSCSHHRSLSSSSRTQTTTITTYYIKSIVITYHQWSIQRQGQLHCHSLLTPSICPGWIPCRRLWIWSIGIVWKIGFLCYARIGSSTCSVRSVFLSLSLATHLTHFPSQSIWIRHLLTWTPYIGISILTIHHHHHYV